MSVYVRFLTISLLCLILQPAESFPQTNAETDTVYVDNNGIAAVPGAVLHLTYIQDMDPSSIFPGRPELVRMDAEGYLYAANHSRGSIACWPGGANVPEKIGERGETGGCYQYINDLRPGPRNMVAVLDSYRSRTLLFRYPGGRPAVLPWNLPFRHYLGYLPAVTDSLLITVKKETRIGRPRTLVAEVIAFDFHGNPVWSIPDLPDGELSVERISARESRIALVENAPQVSICADSQTGQVYIIDGDRYRIRAYSADGRLIRSSRRPYERVRVGNADRRAGVAGEAETGGYDLKNIAAGCLVDDSHRLWIRTNEQRGETTAYDVFDDQGIYRFRFWMTIHPAAFCGGRLYAVQDNNHIGMYRYSITY